MKKMVILLCLLLASANAAYSKLYVGEMDGQFMAGVEMRVEVGFLYLGGDVRTMISRAVFNEEDKVVGFLPDRTDYKTVAGLTFGSTELEYGHVCYHKVISADDLTLYEGNVNPEDTNTLSIRFKF